jgi:hypothetical protein
MAWAGSSSDTDTDSDSDSDTRSSNINNINDRAHHSDSIEHHGDDLCETAHIEDIHTLNDASAHSEDGDEAQLCPELAGTTPTQSDFSPNRFQSSTMTATTPSPQRTGVSPSSSPRLPSPPPFTEVQIGPKSPTIRDGPPNELGQAAKHDDGSTRRIRPGTKAADMASGPPLIPLADVLNLAFSSGTFLLTRSSSSNRPSNCKNISRPSTTPTLAAPTTPSPQSHDKQP